MRFKQDTAVTTAPFPCPPSIVMGVVSVLWLCGCDSVLVVNESNSPATITVSTKTGQVGGLPEATLPGGKVRLDPQESDMLEFIAPQYAFTPPGDLYALLEFDAGNGRIEEVFLPRASTCVVTLNDRDYLDVAVAPALEEADFRNEILARNPGLQAALVAGDKFAAAEILLNWAANHVDDALLSNDSKVTLPLVVKGTVWQTYYDIFKPDQGAVVCGGFAVFLQKLLLFFDIDALIIDFGDLDTGLTHMSVVMPVQDGDGLWRFYLYDPKLNFHAVEIISAAPLGVFEIMDRELNGLFHTVEIVQGSNSQRDFAGNSTQQQDPRYQFRQQKGDRYLYGREGYTLQAHLSDYATEFANGGFSPGPAGFFELMQRKFFTVRRGNNQASRDAFVQELSARQIPLIYPKVP